MKVLIAYGTRKGATAETAQVIAETLRDEYSFDVDVVDLKRDKHLVKKMNLRLYNAVFIGSGIAVGRWTKEAKEFLRSDFGDTMIAIFVSAAATCREAELKEDWKTYQIHESKYIDEVVSKYSIVPFAKRAFGGRMIFFGNTTLDNWDRDIIVSWTTDAGKILTSAIQLV